MVLKCYILNTNLALKVIHGIGIVSINALQVFVIQTYYLLTYIGYSVSYFGYEVTYLDYRAYRVTYLGY